MKRLFSSLVSVLLFATTLSCQNKAKISRQNFCTAENIKFQQFTQKTEDDVKNKLKAYALTLPEGAEASDYCLFDDKLYYVLDYASILTDQSGKGKKVDFVDKYQTTIRCYNLISKEDTLLYTASGSEYMAIKKLQVSEKYLLFSTYRRSSASRNAPEQGEQLNLLSLEKSDKTVLVFPGTDNKEFDYKLTAYLVNDTIYIKADKYRFDSISYLETCFYKFYVKQERLTKIAVTNKNIMQGYLIDTEVLPPIKLANPENPDSSLIIPRSKLTLETLEHENKIEVQVPYELKLSQIQINQDFTVWHSVDSLWILQNKPLHLMRLRAQSVESNQEKHNISEYKLGNNLLLVLRNNKLTLYNLSTETYHNLKLPELKPEPAEIYTLHSNNQFFYLVGYNKKRSILRIFTLDFRNSKTRKE